MTGHRAAIGVPLFLLALASTGAAQTPLLVPGVRVRVTGPCLVDLPSGPAQCPVVVGRLRSWTADSVVVQQGSGAERSIARRATRLVEVSDGIRSYKTLGTLVGAGIGLGVGLAAPCTSEQATNSQALDYFVCSSFRLIVVPLALSLGAGAGRIVGSLIKRESWVSLGVEVTTVDFAPRGGTGLAIGMSVRF